MATPLPPFTANASRVPRCAPCSAHSARTPHHILIWLTGRPEPPPPRQECGPQPSPGASPVPQLVKNAPAMQETPAHSWVGKLPWGRERLPTPEFWPGEFMEYRPWGRKDSQPSPNHLPGASSACHFKESPALLSKQPWGLERAFGGCEPAL